MGGFRSSKTSVAIAAAALLAYQTTGAHAASEHQHLHRPRNLQTRNYKYLGCFKDSYNDRILGEKMADDENTTADFCYDYCDGMGAPFMATQYGIECWCATDVELDFERHGEGAECNFPCAGDENEMCGGYNAIDLYLIGSGQSDGDGDNQDSMAGNPTTPPPVTPTTPSPVAPASEPDSDGGLVGALHPDIVKIIPVAGDNPDPRTWGDSYSVGSRCYMDTTFDHSIGGYTVDTPKGPMTIKELFDQLEDGPGSDGHPRYNDIQCGNGPANNAGDEQRCPGLVGYGRDGCGQIGPMWDLSELE